MEYLEMRIHKVLSNNKFKHVVVDDLVERTIVAGNYNGLLSLLGDNVSTYKHQNDNDSVLHLAAIKGPLVFINELLQSPLDLELNAQNTLGSTPLHLACSSGRLAVVESFLSQKDIDCTFLNNFGQDCLDVTENQQIQTFIKYSRSAFVDQSLKDLFREILHENIDNITKMFRNNRTSTLVDVNTPDSAGRTALQLAIRKGNLELIQKIIEIGADPFIKNRKGKMPIQMTNDPKIIEILKKVPVRSSKMSTTTMSGYLLKYVNFASGYMRRWVNLEDGVLSYYESKKDFPVNCRGSMTLLYSQLIPNRKDKTAFELRTNTNSFHFKANSVAESSRWTICIKEIQKTTGAIGGISGSSTSVDKNQSQFLLAKQPTNQSALDCAILLRSQCNSNPPIKREDLLVSAKNCLFHLEEVIPFNPISNELLLSLKEFLLNLSRIPPHTRSDAVASLNGRFNSTSTYTPTNSTIISFVDDPSSPDEFFDAIDEEGIVGSKVGFIVGSNDVDIRDDAISSDAQTNTKKTPKSAENKFIQNELQGYPLTHRKTLPRLSSDIPPISIWNIIKNAIGKDLTSIPVPVNFSEPISMLQRLCEDLEYSNLLKDANNCSDSQERLMLVIAFAMSGYTSSDKRITKPFNPLLGETFEYVCPVRGFRYISEQVSHHPPISACHCESEDFIYYAEVWVKTNFWGKYIELIPGGYNHVILKRTGEHFTYQKVNTIVNNIIVGRMSMEHYGKMKLVNHSTNEICELDFKQSGWRRSSDLNRVEGISFDSNGNACYKLEGHWNDKLVAAESTSSALGGGKKKTLWRKNPSILNKENLFNFTQFSLGLNELHQELVPWLAPTDSRLRPDQRAMEEGDYDGANRKKLKLETLQREKKKENLSKNPAYQHTAKYFRKELDPSTNSSYWRFLGHYWKKRSRKDWKEDEEVYDIQASAASLAEFKNLSL